MSYAEKNGRAGENGAPEGRQRGMGCFDKNGDAPSSLSKALSFNFQPASLEQFRRTAFELIPLNAPNALDARGRKIGKAPMKGWTRTQAMSVDDAIDHMHSGGNVGVRLRPVDLVVDVDPRNFADGDDPVARLQRDLGICLADYPEVVTGSGGRPSI